VLLVAALIVFTPIGLLEAAVHGFGEIDTDHVDGFAVAAGVGAVLALSITATIGDIFYTGVVAAVVGERRTGVRHQLAEIARTLPYGLLLAVDVIFALVVAVGLVLLIAPGMLAFGWFVLAAPVVEIEDRGIRDAFRRSRELVRGNFWRVLGLLAPVVIVGDALAELLEESGPWILGDGFGGDFLGSVMAEAATVPLFALAAVVTTHHLISGTPPASPRTRPP
jgi:hypothetical protein